MMRSLRGRPLPTRPRKVYRGTTEKQQKQAGGISSALEEITSTRPQQGIADLKKSKQPTNKGRPTAAPTPPLQNKSIAP